MRILLLALILLGNSALQAQTLDNKIAEADALIKTFVDSKNLPGMAVSIYLGDI